MHGKAVTPLNKAYLIPHRGKGRRGHVCALALPNVGAIAGLTHEMIRPLRDLIIANFAKIAVTYMAC
jgi:hypothetical protein